MATLNKYRPYPEYKNNNTEALISLPSTWEFKQVRYLLKDGSEGTKIGPFGSALKLEDMVDDGIQVYGQENVIKRNFSLGKRRVSFRKFKEMKVYEVFHGDILITMMGTSGKCAIVPQDAEKGMIDSHLIRVRVDNKLIIPGFFKFLVDESPEIKYQINIQGKGSIMLGLNSSVIRSLSLPLPSLVEQKIILAFLNYETTKIDKLIEKQQQLIELLKEKRQAVISHAVTKGLNPDVPMKDSGVEWLGEVPEHWDVAKLSFKYEVLLGKMLDDKKITGKYLGHYLRNTDVQWDAINTEELPLMDFRREERERYSVKKGDLLVCEGGEIGRSAIWNSDTPCFYQKALHRLRPLNDSNKTRFMFYVLFYSVKQGRFISAAGKATIAHLPAETFRQYKFAFPPFAEQLDIVAVLDTRSKVFDELEEKAAQQIAFLQERRTALISAAVTGKIDVRDWVAPDTQDIEASQEATA